MADDQNNDPGNQGNQDGDSDNQNAFTINAELLGEFKDDPVFKPFDGKPVSEVLKSFKSAQSLIGGEKMVLPQGKLDTPENWEHVFNKLGRPKDADGYQLAKPADYPENLPYDENMEKTFRQAFHQLGILPKQAAGLYDLWNKYNIDLFQKFEGEQSQKAEETMDALIKELGTKEKYDEYMRGAQAALKRFGGDPGEIQAFIDKFGNDPLVVKVFGNVAKGMLEDAALRGDKTFDLFGEDPKAKLDAILYDKDNKMNGAYWNNSHPQHQSAVDEVYRLQSLIHGTKTVGVI